jgi:large subunit ribosomal protein L23
MELTIYDIIQGPVRSSSKAKFLNTKLSKLTVYIHERATKHQVKDAIEKLFNVRAEKINTLRSGDKSRRMGQKIVVHRGKRKAVITLAKGYTLDLLDTMGVVGGTTASDVSK